MSDCWLPLARAATLGWVPLSKSPLPEPPPTAAAASLSSQLLQISVSGRQFAIRRSSLARYPDTLLGSHEREYFYDEQRCAYFFDRDPELFRYILGFYRVGRLHLPRHVCVEAFEEELEFFGILPDALGDCCYEDYREKKRESNERRLEDNEPETETAGCGARERLWLAFQNPHSSTAARVVYYVTGFFIALSVLANVLETVPRSALPPLPRLVAPPLFFSVDSGCVLVFSVEYAARLYAAPNRCRHAASAMSVVDLAAILPYYAALLDRLSNGNNGNNGNNGDSGSAGSGELGGAFATLRVLRVFRIFKFSRHSVGLRALGYTMRSCASELSFLLFSLTMAVVIFATVLYYVERAQPATAFASIPAASWYTIVTMTTLGYGDMVPGTVIGKLVGSVCSLSGVLVIALPVPVIVSNFSRIYHQNQKADKRRAQRLARQARVRMATNLEGADFVANKRLAAASEQQQQQQQQQQSSATEHCVEAPSESNSFRVQHHHLLACLEQATGREFALPQQQQQQLEKSDSEQQQQQQRRRRHGSKSSSASSRSCSCFRQLRQR